MASQGSSLPLGFFILDALLLKMHTTVTELPLVLLFFGRRTPLPSAVPNSCGLLSVYYRPDVVFAMYSHI